MAGKNGFAGYHLFLGPELGEKKEALAEIRTAGGAGLEEQSYYAGETSVAAIVDHLRNGSLFSPARLFLVKNADAIDGKRRADIELLLDWIKTPQDDTALVLMSDETHITKALEDAAPKGRKRVFYEMFERDKEAWVADFFRREGCRVDRDAIAAILELVENNTDALKTSCSQLLLFAGSGGEVTTADVETWLSHTRQETAFSLFARIARGDLSRSVETMHALLAAKENVRGILSALAWCFRKLRDYLALAESGNANDFEMRKIGLGFSKTREDYTEASRRYASADAPLALIAEYMYLAESSGALLEHMLMDVFLCKLFDAQKKER